MPVMALTSSNHTSGISPQQSPQHARRAFRVTDSTRSTRTESLTKMPEARPRQPLFSRPD